MKTMRFTIGRRTLLAKTCLICGVLYQASEFGKVTVGGTKYFNSWCGSCQQQRSQVTFNQHTVETRETATNHNNLWTDSDYKQLLELTAQNKSAREIAEIMGRTRTAVYLARQRLAKE